MRAQVLRVMGVLASAAMVLGASAQQPADPSARTFETTVVDRVPEFPGGQDAMYAYLGKAVHYPDSAKAKGIKGKVYIGFVVEADGAVTEVEVVKGVDPLLDEEAMRVVRLMPRWTPGEQNGKPVRIRMRLPMNFNY
jgi:TonB family protein